MWKAASNLIAQLMGRNPGTTSGSSSLDPQRTEDLRNLCQRINYQFEDLSLLNQALTHTSYSYEKNSASPENTTPNYESMEFLGDAILELLMSEFLFLSYPEEREGFLSKTRSQMVSTEQLSVLSRNLGLGDYLNLGRGEMKTGGQHKKAILADLFESLLAAIYLDGGPEKARSFFLEQFRNAFENLSKGNFRMVNSKSTLQEQLHAMGLEEPEYILVHEEGPQHKKNFTVEVRSRGRALATGSGSSKKTAEQDAAGNALKHLDLNE